MSTFLAVFLAIIAAALVICVALRFVAERDANMRHDAIMQDR